MEDAPLESLFRGARNRAAKAAAPTPQSSPQGAGALVPSGGGGDAGRGVQTLPAAGHLSRRYNLSKAELQERAMPQLPQNVRMMPDNNNSNNNSNRAAPAKQERLSSADLSLRKLRGIGVQDPRSLETLNKLNVSPLPEGSVIGGGSRVGVAQVAAPAATAASVMSPRSASAVPPPLDNGQPATPPRPASSTRDLWTGIQFSSGPLRDADASRFMGLLGGSRPRPQRQLNVPYTGSVEVGSAGLLPIERHLLLSQRRRRQRLMTPSPFPPGVNASRGRGSPGTPAMANHPASAEDAASVSTPPPPPLPLQSGQTSAAGTAPASGARGPSLPPSGGGAGAAGAASSPVAAVDRRDRSATSAASAASRDRNSAKAAPATTAMQNATAAGAMAASRGAPSAGRRASTPASPWPSGATAVKFAALPPLTEAEKEAHITHDLVMLEMRSSLDKVDRIVSALGSNQRFLMPDAYRGGSDDGGGGGGSGGEDAKVEELKSVITVLLRDIAKQQTQSKALEHAESQRDASVKAAQAEATRFQLAFDAEKRRADALQAELAQARAAEAPIAGGVAGGVAALRNSMGMGGAVRRGGAGNASLPRVPSLATLLASRTGQTPSAEPLVPLASMQDEDDATATRSGVAGGGDAFWDLAAAGNSVGAGIAASFDASETFSQPHTTWSGIFPMVTSPQRAALVATRTAAAVAARFDQTHSVVQGTRRDVAIVCASIQGQAALERDLPAEFELALCLMAHVVRHSCCRYGGTEVKVAHGGSFVFAFPSSAAAVGFSNAVHLLLTRQTSWPERLASHPEAKQRRADPPHSSPGSPMAGASVRGNIFSPVASANESSAPVIEGSLHRLQSGVRLSGLPPLMRQPPPPTWVWNGLRVRMGIAFGPCEPIPNPLTCTTDFVGEAVERAYFLMGLAYGGTSVIAKEVYLQVCNPDDRDEGSGANGNAGRPPQLLSPQDGGLPSGAGSSSVVPGTFLTHFLTLPVDEASVEVVEVASASEMKERSRTASLLVSTASVMIVPNSSVMLSVPNAGGAGATPRQGFTPSATSLGATTTATSTSQDPVQLRSPFGDASTRRFDVYCALPLDLEDRITDVHTAMREAATRERASAAGRVPMRVAGVDGGDRDGSSDTPAEATDLEILTGKFRKHETGPLGVATCDGVVSARSLLGADEAAAALSAAALPTGNVAFMCVRPASLALLRAQLTDDEVEPVVQVFCDVVGAAIEGLGGRIVASPATLSSVGRDGLTFAVFPTVAHAVRCALAFDETLLGAEWPTMPSLVLAAASAALHEDTPVLDAVAAVDWRRVPMFRGLRPCVGVHPATAAVPVYDRTLRVATYVSADAFRATALSVAAQGGQILLREAHCDGLVAALQPPPLLFAFALPHPSQPFSPPVRSGGVSVSKKLSSSGGSGGAGDDGSCVPSLSHDSALRSLCVVMSRRHVGRMFLLSDLDSHFGSHNSEKYQHLRDEIRCEQLRWVRRAMAVVPPVAALPAVVWPPAPSRTSSMTSSVMASRSPNHHERTSGVAAAAAMTAGAEMAAAAFAPVVPFGAHASRTRTLTAALAGALAVDIRSDTSGLWCDAHPLLPQLEALEHNLLALHDVPAEAGVDSDAARTWHAAAELLAIPVDPRDLVGLPLFVGEGVSGLDADN